MCFFLVNPDTPIISTEDVPEQQWERVKKQVLLQLLLVAKSFGKTLPKDVALLILHYAKWGFTMEEAKKHRLELMKERKYFVDNQNMEYEDDVDEEREYSLCEH